MRSGGPRRQAAADESTQSYSLSDRFPLVCWALHEIAVNPAFSRMPSTFANQMPNTTTAPAVPTVPISTSLALAQGDQAARPPPEARRPCTRHATALFLFCLTARLSGESNAPKVFPSPPGTAPHGMAVNLAAIARRVPSGLAPRGSFENGPSQGIRRCELTLLPLALPASSRPTGQSGTRPRVAMP